MLCLERLLRGSRFSGLWVLNRFHASRQVIRHRDGLKDGLTDLSCMVLRRLAAHHMPLIFEEHVRLVLQLVERIVLFLLRELLSFKELVKLIVEFDDVAVAVLRRLLRVS